MGRLNQQETGMIKDGEDKHGLQTTKYFNMYKP